MTFELEFLDGKRAVPRQLLSYRWSGDVTAGCDGLRLHFLWDGDLPEVYRVRGFAPDGACCFFGYADQQKLTVTPGQRRGFVYARSSACLLLDNEALPISLNAPNVDQMVHHYAAPFGFTAALPAGTAPGQYTVEKGTSCFGALQGFMQVLGAKGIFADPENRLCVYGSEAPVTLPGDQITSITAVTVPADTVCSVAGQPYLQFATTKAATIPAGEWTVDVPAISLGKTTAHNVEPGCITVMVNPPAGIRGVTNANRFSGGAAVETDTALRQRICQVQQVPPNGVNTACLAAAVEQLDRVLSCKVCPGGSDYIVTVYVRSRQGQVDDELRLAVTEKLDILTLAGCFIDVQEAKKQPVQLVCSAQILAGADPATVRSALENQLKELCSARVIGGSLHPSALAAALQTDGLCGTPEVHAAGEKGGVIPCSTGAYLEVTAVEVTCYV